MNRPAAPTTQAPSTELSPGQVVLLQAIRDYPAVSLLMNTKPGATMIPDDAAALRQLGRKAAQRLRDEDLPRGADALISTLDRLTDQAATGPTSSAIAVYASQATAELVRLPVTVRDRAVIDPTFATRDLVRALHRTPRHLVLVLSSREARLLDGVGDTLRPVQRSSFPMRGDRERGPDPDRPGLDATQSSAFLRTVDQALGVHLRMHPAPLILVGPDRILAAFTSQSANLGRLAGTITENLITESLTDLATRTRPVLERYLLSRQADALALLDQRTSARRVVSGMPYAWLAARRERPEMLAIEEGLFYPARVSTDGDLLVPATDVEHPEVIDDAVDELIELVLSRGGWVAMVADGALTAHDRVALTLHTSR